MTSNDDRRLIAAEGDPDRAYSHLEPIVEAELSWGNSILYDWRWTDKLLDDRTLTLRQPFHVDLLRQTFRFPPNIRMYAMFPRPGYRERGRVMINDLNQYVTIDAPLPKDWPYGSGHVDL